MIPDNIPGKNRPVVRKLVRERVTHARYFHGHIQFDYDRRHIDKKVILKPVVMVGDWSNRPGGPVYVHPGLKNRRERESVAIHEAVEQHVHFHHHLPRFPAHYVAERVEVAHARKTRLPLEPYSWHVEELHRKAIERAQRRRGRRKRRR